MHLINYQACNTDALVYIDTHIDYYSYVADFNSVKLQQ